MIQSPASKSLNGNGLDLFSMMVLNRPGSKVVLPVWNSFVLAFSIVINFESSLLKTFVVKSALEHKAKFKTSLNWPCAISCLSRSVNLFNLSLEPTVAEGGRVGIIFL